MVSFLTTAHFGLYPCFSFPVVGLGQNCEQRATVRQGRTLVHCRVVDLPAVLGCLGEPSGCSNSNFGSVNFGEVAHDLVTCALDVQLEIAKKAAGAKINTLADGLAWMRSERLASSAALRPSEKLNAACDGWLSTLFTLSTSSSSTLSTFLL